MKSIELIKNILKDHSPNCNVLCSGVGGGETDNTFKVSIPYYNTKYNYINNAALIKSIENLKDQKHIKNLHIIGNNLDVIFNDLNEIDKNEIIIPMENGNKDKNYEYADEYNNKISQFDIIKNLFWKRYLHFKRNYKLLICVLILPVIFEIIAMGFMKIRPQGDHENPLKLSKNLYNGNQEFYRYFDINNLILYLYREVIIFIQHFEILTVLKMKIIQLEIYLIIYKNIVQKIVIILIHPKMLIVGY